MDTLLALLTGVVLACGAHLLLSRDLFRVVLGAMLLTSAANLAVIVLGRTRATTPAFVPADADSVAPALLANPLPQAFVLTAIVIGLAMFAFLLALIVPIAARLGTLDTDELRAAEPRDDERGEGASSEVSET